MILRLLAYTKLNVRNRIFRLRQTFIIGEKSLGSDDCAMILGDIMFCDTDLGPKLQTASSRLKALLFSPTLSKVRGGMASQSSTNKTRLSILKRNPKVRGNAVPRPIYISTSRRFQLSLNPCNRPSALNSR